MRRATTRQLRVAVASVATFALLSVSAFLIGHAQTPRAGQRVVIYASVGSQLTLYDVNVEGALLDRRGSVTLPANVAEAWAHPSGRFLYVVWSTDTSRLDPGGEVGAEQPRHGVSAFRIDPFSGGLIAHGDPVLLPSASSYVTVDTTGTHLLITHSLPSGITVLGIRPDGGLGAQVQQVARLDLGFHPHCVRVDSSNSVVMIATRGRYSPDGKSGNPGALKLFDYRDGALTNRSSVPKDGTNFQARHLDVHPSSRWAFLTLENQNKLVVYEIQQRSLGSALFTKDTLAQPDRGIRPLQIASTVHVHPNGRYVYVGNRATDTTSFQGRPVFAGGENSIAAYAIDQGTGEPTLIQSVDTFGFSPRTFALDPSGRMLVVANQAPFSVRDGASVRVVAAGLSVFRVGTDGKLDFARKYDVETVSRSLGWMGLVALP